MTMESMLVKIIKLAIMNKFIYNILSEFILSLPHLCAGRKLRRADVMMNFNNKKTKRVVSAVIVILIVLAMIIPTLAYLM